MTAWEFRSVDVPHNIELLRDLKPNEIDLILAAGRPRRFPAKSVMTHQDHPAEHLLLLWKGLARYFYETPHNKRLILKWITPGHIFGGAALVSGPSKYLVSTEAVRESIVVEGEKVLWWSGMAQPFVASHDGSLNSWKTRTSLIWIMSLGMSLPTPP